MAYPARQHLTTSESRQLALSVITLSACAASARTPTNRALCLPLSPFLFAASFQVLDNKVVATCYRQELESLDVNATDLTGNTLSTLVVNDNRAKVRRLRGLGNGPGCVSCM
mgnify:CR=1 FL=1